MRVGTQRHPTMLTMVYTAVCRPGQHDVAAVSETSESETLCGGCGIHGIRRNRGCPTGGILKQGPCSVDARGRHPEHLGGFTHGEPLDPLQIAAADSLPAAPEPLPLTASPRQTRVD